MAVAKLRPGRPPKFGRRARAVTITLPEDVLDSLASIDTDLGRAIVRVIERRRTPKRAAPALAEVSRYGRHAVIVVTPVRALKRLAGVELVPIGNGRALISLQPPHSITSLELSIRDVLERGDIPPVERMALEAIARILRSGRVSRGMRLHARTIIVLEGPAVPRRASRAESA